MSHTKQRHASMTFHHETDLEIERLIKAAPETIWRCWEDPELFKQWFCPKPVEVTEVDNHFHSGGRAYNVMRLPDGTEFHNDGCFVFVDAPNRIVMTDALTAGFRPAPKPFMTADIRLTPQNDGTLYHAHVMHHSPEDRQKHEGMGFEEGWGTTLAQLAVLAEGM